MIDARQWTRIWVKRTLARMPRDVFVDGERASDVAKVHLPAGESVVGVYAVAGASDSQGVIVAEESLVLFDGRWCRVPYASMTRTHIDIAGITKMELDKVRIEQDDGTMHFVAISGGGERDRDVFEFVRFLMRVSAAHRTPSL